MNQSIHGIFRYNYSKTYCSIMIQNQIVNIIIPKLYCNGALDGDEVSISILSPNYWEVIDLITGNIIQSTKPNDNFKMFLPQIQITNIIQLIQLIQQVNGRTIVAVGKVDSIHNTQDIECTGYIEHRMFFCDDKRIPVCKINNSDTNFHRVKGRFKRREQIFEVESIIQYKQTKEKSKANEMDDSETIIIMCDDITQQNTQLCTPDSNIIYCVEPENDGIHFDLRNRRVFTIDNKETKMRDDALHICFVAQNEIEIGIHCIDFTDEITAQQISDIINGKREGNSGNLFDKKKSESLSLNKGKICSAFSVLFNIDLTRQCIQKVRIGKTIIRINTNLTFDQFDNVCKGTDSSFDSCFYPKEQIIKDCLNLKMVTQKILLPSLKGYTKQGDSGGDDIIRILGEFVGRVVGEILYRNYGDLAIVLKFRNIHFASFRSPLRKVHDMCVIKQLESVSCHYNDEEMALYVCYGKEGLEKLIKQSH
ncbi:hypothetical protein CL6EHI_163470 [Entamoeba histolytica]|uniref:RNB domain-containing protein n=7 Tax=Entamoeba histolytica TaxID=5759 RepID=C4M3S8_ENTH1|nr:hypothetical protein EHI_163470 [Entamoeba histolytica HM-1:IMSS]EAL44577.1 hypothetical protein EHI_163470 [Entamoeba histolytica HM-1:IMSS]GAT95991.1 hypothetical protein CL6EHI_163470 [Entamoeba histolytica]|eukprot:XP_649963.1 hypothetical protein EHI_163470 [Entamoeba histolytica HM-1:IMSS]